MIAKCFQLNITAVNPACILMNAEDYVKYDEKISFQQIHLYQKKIESILYVLMITRSDVVKTASKLSEFLQNPSFCHHAAANQVIFYLYRMKSLAIKFSANIDEADIFACSSDAAFADDKETRHSSEDYLFKLFGGIIE